MKYKGKMSVIMPAYNEEKIIIDSLLDTVKTISSFMEDYEIILVDDGSTDDTVSNALKAAENDPLIHVVRTSPNAGKGRALCVGTAFASGDYVAFCDSDLELHPRQLQRFMEEMLSKNADAVIGCKFHPESKVKYPKIRRIYSFGYYLILRVLFRLDTQDTQTGLKLFKKEIIKPIMRNILVKRFAFDIEVLSLIKKRGGTIIPAPVEMQFRRFSSRIDFRDVWETFWDTIRVFYRLNILHYYERYPDNPEIIAAVESAERLS